MYGKINVGGGSVQLANGELGKYRSAAGDIPPNTFVQFVQEYAAGTQYSATETSYLKDCFELTKNTAVVLDYDHAAYNYYATEYRLADDGTITRGNRTLITKGTKTYSRAFARGLRLSDTEFVVVFENASDRTAIIPCSISGDDITPGTAVQIGFQSSAKFGKPFLKSDGTMVCLFHQGSKIYYADAMYADGEITITQAETEIGSAYEGVDADRLSDDKYVYLYADTSERANLVVITFTGGAATMGTTVAAGSFGDYNCGKVVCFSGKRFALAFLTSTKVSVLGGMVDGDVITVGTAASSSNNGFKYLALAKLDPCTVAIAYLQDLTSKYYCYLNAFRIAGVTATLLDTQQPFGAVSMDRLYSDVILRPVGDRLLAVVDKGTTIESIIVDYTVKATKATSAIEGITRAKLSETVKGDVWVLGG